MIRIWNQNSSRVNTHQGLRTIIVEEHYTKQLLFAGEAKKAKGTMENPFSNQESILFLEQQSLIRKLWKNDWLAAYQTNKKSIERQDKNQILSLYNERPKTNKQKTNDSQ